MCGSIPGYSVRVWAQAGSLVDWHTDTVTHEIANFDIVSRAFCEREPSLRMLLGRQKLIDTGTS